MSEIQIVPIDVLNRIIEKGKPKGLFLSREKRNGRQRGKFIAVDNLNGDCWTEIFDNLHIAEDWLNGKFEVEEE